MRDTDSHGERSNNEGDGLTMTRRVAMAILGAGALVGGSGVAAAQEGNGSGNDPTRKWNQHIDAQDHDLRNVGEFDANVATLGNVRTAARDADVLVWQDPEGAYHADGAEETVYSGEEFTAAVQAAIDSLTDGRTTKEKVVVACSGTMGPHEWDGDVLAIDIPSYTIVDFRGTIHVEDENEALIRPLRALNAEEIEISRVAISGNFRSAIWFRSVSNVRFGHIDVRTPEDSAIEATGGGFRLDGFAEGRGDDAIRSTDIQVDSAYFENVQGHAFETYAVDRIQVGQVIANGGGQCGVLLNDTSDATVNAVVGKDLDVGGGYAAFRLANGCEDVTCGQVVARNCARGVFTVSASSNATINSVNIVGTTSHGILIQDGENVSVNGGLVKNTGAEGVRVDSRSDPQHPPAEGVSVSNLRVVDDRDNPQMPYGISVTAGPRNGRDTNNVRVVDNDVRGAGTEGGINVEPSSVVVRDNVGDGVAAGTTTLSTGSDPAATVANVTEQGQATLDLRSKVFDPPGTAFAYDHRFEYNGSGWDLVFEWVEDPGEDLTLDYVVDQPQALVGRDPASGGGDDGGDGGGGDDTSWDYDTSPGVVDDFEGGDIDEYEGTTGDYEANQTSPVPSGDYRLEGTGGENSKLLAADLDRMPAEGTKFSAKIGATSDAENAGVAFGSAKSLDADSAFPFHFTRLWKSGEDDWRFQVWQREGNQVIESSVGAVTLGEFYEVVIDWGDGELTATLNDPDGNQVAQQTTSFDTEYTEGGIGTRGTGLLDEIRILEDNT